MAISIKVAVYTNSDDAFVAWAPSAFIADCRGFKLERMRGDGGQKIDLVENRVGFARDKPKSGEHRPSDVWPFQRFNWTDHAVDVGAKVKYRVTAMLADPAKKGGLVAGPASAWTAWAQLQAEVGDGFSCYFNRGLVLSQFVARYLRRKKLSPAAFKKQLKANVDPVFRRFLAGDLGAALFETLQGSSARTSFHAALYELDDDLIEQAIVALAGRFDLVLSNGSDKSGDGNAAARKTLKQGGVDVVDRLLKSKGLGHNKFLVLGTGATPKAVWTGSTNWSTTGLCTQVNNALLIEDAKVAGAYLAQWNRLRDASPPKLDPANFPKPLVQANDKPASFKVGGAAVTVWFTRTSDGRDMDALRELIAEAKDSILFLMFTPGKDGLHLAAAERAADRHMYIRGVVSTLGNQKGDNAKNVLDIQLVSTDKDFKPDRYTVVQPQGEGKDFGAWIAEVTRSQFLSQIGHAIVHSKVMVLDALSDQPVVITGSHNLSTPASRNNDENLVIVRGHQRLAQAYATNIMSVYQHYRFRSYVRETEAAGKTPWSYLDDDDRWLRAELRSKAQEIRFWTGS